MAMTDQLFFLETIKHRIPLPIRFSVLPPFLDPLLGKIMPYMTKFSKSVRIREFKLVKYEAQSIFLDRTFNWMH
jgi:hypothetical protein